MAQYSPHQLDISGAYWVDVNTLVGNSALPDRLPDQASIISCSLVNLFNCPIGARGPLFEPTYGCLLYQFLQEPVDDVTARDIRISLIQSINKWEPRIVLDYSGTSVLPDYTLPGYRVRLAFTVRLTGEIGEAVFNLNKV